MTPLLRFMKWVRRLKFAMALTSKSGAHPLKKSRTIGAPASSMMRQMTIVMITTIQMITRMIIQTMIQMLTIPTMILTAMGYLIALTTALELGIPTKKTPTATV